MCSRIGIINILACYSVMRIGGNPAADLTGNIHCAGCV